MTAQVLVVFEIWRFFVMFFFSTKLHLILFLLNFIFPTVLVWGCQWTLKVSDVANLASNCDCSSLCSFPDMTFFCYFSKNFQKIYFFFLQILKFLNPVGIARDFASNCGCSNLLVFFEIWRFFSGFFKKVFFRKLIFQFLKIWNPQRCSWILQELSHELQILRPNATAQIVLDSEMWCFLIFQRF